MPPIRRDRAQVVCVTCHARKVRCNLQNSRGAKCQNCDRNNLECVVRTGPRSGRLAEAMRSASSIQLRETSNMPLDQVVATIAQSPARSEPIIPDPSTAQSMNISNEPSSYLGDHTLLAHDAVTETCPTSAILPLFTPQTNSLLQFAQATVLPKSQLVAALTESYFQNVFARYPVAERSDLADSECSTLLRQSICMAGSLMRHSSKSGELAFSHSLYEKMKVMLFLNQDPDPIENLASLCLMICWSPNTTDVYSFDCPWQWTGTAIRLAVQMGLHKESTYLGRPQAARLRRLWWILMNADRLQSACFGRPLAVRPSDSDTRLPSNADFEKEDIASLVFIHYPGVTVIWGEIADFGVRGASATAADIERLTCALCAWITSLPEEIRLYDSCGNRLAYRQSVSELHMVYFVAIILLEALRLRKHDQFSSSIPSIIAASCIARLIEEVDCWDDLSSMSSTSTFYIMAACIPILYYRSSLTKKKEARQEELQIICSALEQMAPRWGGAFVVRRNIEKIRNMVERHPSGQHHDVSDQASLGSPGYESQQSKIKEIFPFPQSLCPNMDLLNEDCNGLLDFDSMILPLGDDTLPWAFMESESTFDIFKMNLSTEAFPLVDEPFGTLPPGTQ